jgi:drug/metabolite transporter (DMT)-like permease
VRNRGIGRARMFMGGLLLFAAVIAWGTSLMMSPHGQSVASGMEHVRTTVVIYLRNSAIGTLILCALAAWLLFPARRPRWPARDWVIIGVITMMVLTSLYQLIWLRSVLH